MNTFKYLIRCIITEHFFCRIMNPSVIIALHDRRNFIHYKVNINNYLLPVTNLYPCSIYSARTPASWASKPLRSA